MELLEVELLLVLLLFLLLLLPPLFLLVVVFLLVFPEPPLVVPPLVVPPLIFPLLPFCPKSASAVVFRVIIVYGVHTSPASVLNSFRKVYPSSVGFGEGTGVGSPPFKGSAKLVPGTIRYLSLSSAPLPLNT